MSEATATKQTASAAAIADASPYLGLSSFAEADRALFHGRGDETEELLQLVQRETISIVFGVSGLGKSSLLRAGLFPRLRETLHFPIVVRLTYGASGAKGDLVQQIRDAIALEIDAHKIDADKPPAGQTLWEYFHRTPFWDARNRPLVPVIVIDQFEELFTLGARDANRDALLTELGDLVENRIPARVRAGGDAEALPPSYEHAKAKVVLSLREDYLARLEDLRPAMPSLGRGRFRLHPMAGDQAIRAVRHARTEKLIDLPTSERVVRFVAGTHSEAAADADLGELTVEPALLSLVCRALDERRQARGEATISPDLLRGESVRILDDFYERSIADLDPRVGEYLEEHLLTPDGHRTTVAIAAIERAPGMANAVSTLVDRRLLRIEERLGRPHVEVIHDVLTRVLIEHRDKRRAASVEASEVAAKRRRARRRRYIVAAVVVAAALVGAWLLWRRADRRERDRAAAQQRAFDELRRADAESSSRLLFAEAKEQLESDEKTSAMRILGVAYKLAFDGGALTDELRLVTHRFTAQNAALDTVLRAHTKAVTHVEFSPDGTELLTSSEDGTMLLWDVRRWNEPGYTPRGFIQPAEQVKPEAPSAPPDEATAPPREGREGRAAAAETATVPITSAVVSWRHRRAMTVSEDAVVLWDLGSDKPLGRVERNSYADTAVQLGGPGPDDLWCLVSDSKQGFWHFDGKELAPWPVKSDALVAAAPELFDAELRVGAVLSPDGRFLAVQTHAKGVGVFTLGATPALAHQFDFGKSMTDAELEAHYGDLSEYERMRRYSYEDERVRRIDVSFSPDGKWLWTSGALVNTLYSTDTWKENEAWTKLGFVTLRSFDAATPTLAALVELASGELASLTMAGEVAMRLAKPCDGVRAADLSGDVLAYVGDCDEVRVSARDQMVAGALDLEEDDLAITAAGRRVADRTEEGAIRVWHLDRTAGDRLIARPQSGEGDTPLATMDVLSDGTLSGRGELAVLPDGKRVVAGVIQNVVDPAQPVVGIFDVAGPQIVAGATLPQAPSKDRKYHGMSHIEVLANGVIVTVGRDRTVVVREPDGKIRRSFGELITHAIVSEDGKRVVTGGRNGGVGVWDLDTGVELAHDPGGGTHGVYSLGLSRDGKVVVSGDEDGNIRAWVWETAAPRQLAKLTNEIRGVALDPGATLLGTVSDDGTGRLFDLTTDTEVLKIEDQPAFTDLAVIGRDQRTMMMTSLTKMHLVDLSTRAVTDTLPLIGQVASIEQAGDKVLLCELGGYVEEWDLARKVITGRITLPMLADDRQGDTWCEARYAGDRIVTLIRRTMALWPADLRQGLVESDRTVKTIRYARAGDRFASFAGDVRVWDVRTGALLEAPRPSSSQPWFVDDGRMVFQLSDGRLAVLAPDGSLAVGTQRDRERWRGWLSVDHASGAILGVDTDLRVHLADASDPATLREDATFAGQGVVEDVEFSADGASLLVARERGALERYDLAGKRLAEGGTIPDGAELIGRTPGGLYAIAENAVATWRDGDPAPRVVPARDSILRRGAAWDAATDTLLVASRDRVELFVGGASRWWITGRIDRTQEVDFVALDVAKQRALVSSSDHMALISLQDGHTLRDFDEHAWDVVDRAWFLADGDTLITQGLSDGLRFWSAATGKLLAEVRGTQQVAMGPDGASFAVLTAEGVELVRIRNGKPQPPIALEGCSGDQRGWFRAITWATGGSRIAVTRSDDEKKREWVCVWDLGDGATPGKAAVEWASPTNDTWRILLSPDGSRLAMVGNGGTVRVTEVPGGKPLWKLGPERVLDLGFVRGKPYMITVDADRMLRFLDLAEPREIAARELPAVDPEQASRIERADLDEQSGHVAIVDDQGQLQIWDATTGTRLRSTKVDGGAIELLVIAPGGKAVAVSTYGETRLWTDKVYEVASESWTSETALAFSPDARWLAVANESGRVSLVDAVTGEELLDLNAPVSVNALEWAPDMRTLAVGGARGFTKLFDLGLEQGTPEEVRATLEKLAWRPDRKGAAPPPPPPPD